MKAFRFDAKVLVQGFGIKRDTDLERVSGTRQDTGFVRRRKVRTQIPVCKIDQRAAAVHA